MQLNIAAADERLDALRLVCSRDTRHGGSQAQQLLELMDRGSLPFEGLWVARHEGRLIGAALAQIMPGRTAVMWPPQVAPGASDTTALALVDASLRWIQDAGVELIQCPVRPFDDDAERRLRAANFAHLANIQYLVAYEADFPVSPPASELSLDVVQGEADRRELQDVLLQTYLGTLDCPQLSGRRRMEDVLAGYEATGRHRSDWWRLVRWRDLTAGCLLLTDHPDLEQAELVYMGLVPERRGRGLARDLVRLAQWLTRQAGRRQLVLAVDEANRPARHVYRQADFVVWDRRSVWFRQLQESPSHPGINVTNDGIDS